MLHCAENRDGVSATTALSRVVPDFNRRVILSIRHEHPATVRVGLQSNYAEISRRLRGTRTGEGGCHRRSPDAHKLRFVDMELSILSGQLKPRLSAR
jgi:hypothetical protein